MASVLAGLTFALAGCGDASPPAKSSPAASSIQSLVRQQFKISDADANGMVSRSEARAEAMRDFRAMDVNADGSVTVEDFRAELSSGRAPRSKLSARQVFEVSLPWDYSKDGMITFAEYWRHVYKDIFLAMDADRDGQVSEREVLAYKLRRGHAK